MLATNLLSHRIQSNHNLVRQSRAGPACLPFWLSQRKPPSRVESSRVVSRPRKLFSELQKTARVGLMPLSKRKLGSSNSESLRLSRGLRNVKLIVCNFTPTIPWPEGEECLTVGYLKQQVQIIFNADYYYFVAHLIEEGVGNS